MRKYILSAILLTCCWLPGFSVQAQIMNIERKRTADKDTSQVLVGTIALSANVRQQQVQVVTFNQNGNLAYLTKKHIYMLIGTANFVRTDGSNNINDSFLHLRANFLRAKPLSYESFAQSQYDRGRGLRNRYLVGQGLRYRFYESEKLDLSFSPGLMFEHERWTQPLDAAPEKDSTVVKNLPKATIYQAARWQPTESFSLNSILYYQARFNRFFQPRLIGEVNVLMKVTRILSLNFQFSVQYDAIPVLPTIDPLNYALVNGVLFSF